jgi:hypothetical protein
MRKERRSTLSAESLFAPMGVTLAEAPVRSGAGRWSPVPERAVHCPSDQKISSRPHEDRGSITNCPVSGSARR